MQVSIWERETFFAHQDLIIIGSGFTGLWSAFHLIRKNPFMKITILERGLIPSGASTRNAGFACFGSLSEVVYDGQAMGTDKMLELVELRFRGLEKIRKFFSKKQIDYEPCGGYELYDEEKGQDLEGNIDYINSLLKSITGSKETYKKTDNKIDEFGFGNTAHLVENAFEGALHSGKLLQALLQSVQSMGVTVLNSIEVRNYEGGEGGYKVFTSHVPFTCSKILLCTNAFTASVFPDLDIIPARGQVILTSPLPSLPFCGTFHSDEGFYYFRNLGDRVLLGGARNKAFEEEETLEMMTSENIQYHLEHYLHTVVLPKFSGQYSIEHRWAGIMAMGSEKLPIIKELEPGIFCAVRMSGMGVALAPVAGQMVSKMISS